MILRARLVATMDGPVIEDGAVEVQGNRITAVGRWSELRGSNCDRVLDLGECVLLPGLINAHCHLDYTCLCGAIPRPHSFTAWIGAINEWKASLTPDDYIRSIKAGFDEAASYGTTSLANFTAFPELAARTAPAPLRIWWFAEMIDVRAAVSPAAEYETLRRMSDPLAHFGLAPHAPFTASVHLYRGAAAFAAEDSLLLSTHLAESRDEMQMFRDGRGPLFELMQEIGRPVDDCGRQTPLTLMLQRELLDEGWIIAHLNELSVGDFALLTSNPKFQIVHCPRSHAYFGHAPFAFEKLRALGFAISLGTDSLASNDNLSLLAELRHFHNARPSVSPKELLAMVTINPAAALRQADSLGRIRRGFLADLIAVPNDGDASHALEKIVAFSGKVPWRMIDGVVRA